MRFPRIHVPLLHKIIILVLLGIMSTIVIAGTIYLIERLPAPLLDKSINFHSVVMHETNKLVIYINSRGHEINYDHATGDDEQQVHEISYAINKYLLETGSLYQKYGFTAGTRTLARLRADAERLHSLITRTSDTHTTDLTALREPVASFIDGLQQLYRLHEVDDTRIREQLVHYQRQHALIIFPLIIVIFLFSGVLGFLLIRNIVQSLAIQKRLERELRDTAKSHQQILDSMFVFVGLFTVDGRLLEVNEAPLRASGLGRDEVIGKVIWETYSIAYSQESIDAFKSCITRAAAGEIVHQDLKILIKDGQFVYLDNIFSPVFDDKGRVVNVIGSGVDISARKHMEDELRFSEARYRMLMETLQDGVFVSQDYKFVFANTALPRMLGYTHEEFLGLPFGAIVAPEFLDLWTSRYTQRIGKGPEPPGKYELRMLRKGGKEDIWVILQAQRIDYGGKPAVFGVIHDLTERKRAESALRRYEHIVSGSHNLISFIDRNYTFQVISDAYPDIFRKRREDIVNHTLADLYGEDFFLAHQKEPFDRALEGQMAGYEAWFDLPALGRRYIVIEYTPFRESDGTISGIIVYGHDITERKLAEEVLRDNEEQLRQLNETLELRVTDRTRELNNERNFINSVLDTAGALVFVLDRKGCIVRFNRACENLTGFRLDEIKNLPFWQVFIPPDQTASMQSIMEKLTAASPTARGECEWLTRNGERRHIEWSYSILKDDTLDSFSYIIGTGIDITDRKKAEMSLIKAKEEAEQASLAKSQFLSRMSHELRTPMNAILGFSQILELEIQVPEQLDSIREILKASRHLLDLINELLDLSRIEAGRLHITLEPLSPATLVTEAVNLIRPLVDKKNLILHNQIAPSCDTPVLADPTRLRQVLVNLLSNAAKYNKPGGVIRIECTSHDNDILRLSVADTGPGIDPEKQSLLFQPFERLGAEGTFEEGAGIGLALSKRLVELMGGRIGVQSQVGKGSTFWLDLPRAESQVANLVSPTVPVPGGKERYKVLYVEDNMANLRLVERVLSRYPSLFLISAVNGETGLELARSHHPDVILLDIHLPGIDGYEVLKRLGKEPATADIPVIAVSADAMPLDIERGMKAGFRRYLTKPINIEELVEVITSILPGETSKTATRH